MKVSEMLVSLKSPGEVAAAVPGLLGFHPKDSLVVILLEEREVRLTMRMDLPGVDVMGEAGILPWREIIRAAEAAEADAVVLVVVDPVGGDRSYWSVKVGLLAYLLTEAGLQVAEAVLVQDSMAFPLLSDDPGSEVPTSVPAMDVARVIAGVPAAADSREELLARFAPRPDLAPDADMIAVWQAANLWTNTRTRAERTWDAVVRLATMHQAPEPLTTLAADELRANVMVAVQDVNVRDYVMAQAALDDALGAAVMETITGLAVVAPSRLRPRLAGMASMLQMALGSSSLPVTAMIEMSDGDSLAVLVDKCLDVPIRPDLVREMLKESMRFVDQRLDDDPVMVMAEEDAPEAMEESA